MTLVKSDKRKVGRPALPNAQQRQREYVRQYRQRQRERREYMEAVTDAAERLQKALAENESPQLILPLELVATNTPQTLYNVAAFVEAENARNQRNKNGKNKGR